MKRFIWMMVGLLVVVVALAGPVIARLTHPRTDCSNRVEIVKGPRGAPLECVCIEGTLATCFTPGP